MHLKSAVLSIALMASCMDLIGQGLEPVALFVCMLFICALASTALLFNIALTSSLLLLFTVTSVLSKCDVLWSLFEAALPSAESGDDDKKKDKESGLAQLSGTWRLVYSSGFSSGSIGGRQPGPTASLLPARLGQVCVYNTVSFVCQWCCKAAGLHALQSCMCLLVALM